MKKKREDWMRTRQVGAYDTSNTTRVVQWILALLLISAGVVIFTKSTSKPTEPAMIIELADKVDPYIDADDKLQYYAGVEPKGDDQKHWVYRPNRIAEKRVKRPFTGIIAIESIHTYSMGSKAVEFYVWNEFENKNEAYFTLIAAQKRIIELRSNASKFKSKTCRKKC